MGENIICNRCQKPILDLSYVEVRPTIVLQKYMAPIPPVFSCPEHAENFATPMRFHDDCWIAELKDHGVPIHDMKEVIKKYNGMKT